LTSLESCSEMRPGAITTGVKERPTPNCLNTTVTLPSRSRLAGTGNSPPARNLAVSPETAVRLGSASMCTRPTGSSALSTPWALLGLEQGIEVLIELVTVGRPVVMVWVVDATPFVMEVTVLLPLTWLEPILEVWVGLNAPGQTEPTWPPDMSDSARPNRP